jgi:hypothetical protein
MADQRESLYYTRQESLYYPRARTSPTAHPAPNNVGVVLLVVMVLAIVVAVAVVGPGLIGEVRQMVYCLEHAQEAAC